jgi:single-stranded DNA-binding protein
MNSCILMAEIIKDPELRYTAENQTAIAEMLVQFPGLRAEDPVETLKVVGWGNLAQQIQERFHQGDRVVIEGRLNMNTIDRPEGFKEKRAELTAARIHPIGADNGFETIASSPPDRMEKKPAPSVEKPAPSMEKQEPAPAAEEPSTSYDDIPF